VLVANHASYVDAILLLAKLPIAVRFAAKREFATMPLFGFVFRRLGVHFVGRVDPVRGVEDTREITAAVRSGESVLLFPEGTFTRIPGLAPFHLGAFAIAAEAHVPVVAITLRGTRSVLRASRWLPVRHGVTITVQRPLMPDGDDWSAAVRLRERTRQAMLHHCGEPDLAPS
jgi:1-acyl-sn-glycerol-3-phosphate acyltransferase